MNNLPFYILLYCRPIANQTLFLLGQLTIVIGLGIIVVNAVGGFWHIPSLALSGVCFLVSFLLFLLREKYTALLLRLQPEGTNYTFYD